MNIVKRYSVLMVLVALVGSALLATAPSVQGKTKGLTAVVSNGAGDEAGTLRFVPTDDGKVQITARLSGLTPGFHGFHVHSVATCDPAAVDTGGNPVPFFTAGGHYNPVTTNTHGAHAGDMPPLLVAEDGTAFLRFKTDRFTNRDLMDEDGSAVIVHAGADNLANIPGATATGGERYHSHVDDVFGPDTATKATGDAGSRYGCGVIAKA
ncbi:MAG: superoxide dismutase family protein [Actinomycetota bacterium]